MTRRGGDDWLSERDQAEIYRMVKREGFAMLHSVRFVLAVGERVRAGTGPWPAETRTEFTRLWYAFMAARPRRLLRHWAALHDAAMKLAQVEAEAEFGEE
jgi:hypothetical protein